MKDTTLATIPMHPTALFEAVFNHSPVGNYLLSPTPEATILAVNDAFLEASGCRREDLVGISLFVAFPGNPDDPFDSGESALRSSLARVAATGRADTLPAQRYPIRVQLPNGGIVFEERFWDAVSTPIFGADGSILCISHTTSDVTERVRAVTAIRESEARFRALTHASADVIYRMSPDWTELRQLQGRGFIRDNFNPCSFWLEDYVPMEDRDAMHAAIAEAIRNKSVFELEHRVHRVDGSQGWTLSRAVPMFGEDGEIEEWIGAASDITERKTAEEKLRELDRRKDEFLAMLAHELRNPLAPIGAAAELLQRARPDEGLVRNTSQIIGRQVRHMTALINDLLDVSRVTRGLVELDKTTLDIARIADDAVEQVLPLIQSRGQQLGLVLPDEPALVCGDKKRLVQVLANLLNNAAKYTQEDGQLRVEVQADAAWIRIAVLDNGIGMAPELVARAFDLFTQAERSVDRSSGGLGLGLALVRQLVELHGGTVSCDSPGLGHGSRFTVALPRLAAQEAPAPQDADAGLAGPRPLRILVVDDNEDAADTLAMLLETSGHEVLVEHGSQAALERALSGGPEGAPQVCLLDIGLPDMDGAELARRLRARPETANALLVAVTGYGQESDRARTRDAGFDHHLVKPIDLDKLHAVLGERTQAASTTTGMRIR
jgi:signal transduction histidine kinase/ActR/RegA family two-component response regulator